MSNNRAQDWDPGTYQRFRGLRLRPALELLAQVRDLPPGPVFDVGCGSGAVAEALSLRYPSRDLWGVDTSPNMLHEAEATGRYHTLVEADAIEWEPDGPPPALVFANALAHGLAEHDALFAHWAGWLAPRGALAVQMPRQFDAPSHALLRDLAAEMFPDRFDFSDWTAPVARPEVYADMLAPLGALRVWETTYVQTLPEAKTGHPVRRFIQSTAMRPIFARMDADEAARYTAAYDALLTEPYPRRPDGSVSYPVTRVFVVVERGA